MLRPARHRSPPGLFPRRAGMVPGVSGHAQFVCDPALSGDNEGGGDRWGYRGRQRRPPPNSRFDPDASTLLLLEMEATLAHHTTGRSAALLLENLGTSIDAEPLCSASLDYLRHTPEDLVDSPACSPLGPVLHVGTVEQDESVDQMLAEGIEFGHHTDDRGRTSTRPCACSRRYAVSGCTGPSSSQTAPTSMWGPSTSRSFGDFGGQVGRIATSTRVDAATPDGDGLAPRHHGRAGGSRRGRELCRGLGRPWWQPQPAWSR